MFTRHLIVLVGIIAYFPGPVFAGQYRFEPRGSEFSVTFPDTPDTGVATVARQDGIDVDVQYASIVLDDCILKAECYSIDMLFPNGFNSDEALRAQALNYATTNGLAAAEAKVNRSDEYTVVSLRAAKTIDGTPVTYYNETYIGTMSVMILYTGTMASQYPTNHISAFLESIRYKANEAENSDAEWILYQNTPTGAKRYIDVANVQRRNSIAQYRQKFTTSSGRSLISIGQVDCRSGKSRTIAFDVSDDYGHQYLHSDTPFQLAWNDYSEMYKHDCLCRDGKVQEYQFVKSRALSLRTPMLDSRPYNRSK